MFFAKIPRGGGGQGSQEKLPGGGGGSHYFGVYCIFINKCFEICLRGYNIYPPPPLCASMSLSGNKKWTYPILRFEIEDTLIKLHSVWKTIEHFLAKYECGVDNLGKNLQFLCPPDKDVVERNATGDDDERHSNTEPFVQYYKEE